MTPEQEEFEAKYHLKIVIPRYEGIPYTQYLITCALYHWEDEKTILALYPPDRSSGIFPITFKVNDDELKNLLESIEIVGELSQEQRNDFQQLIDKKMGKK